MNPIVRLEHGVWQAVLNKNGEQLADMFSEDYIEVTADGKRVFKDRIVEVSPQVDDIESYEIADVSIVELGPDVTILSYHLNLRGRLRGEPIDPPSRWATSVWRLDEGTWKCCFFQQTADGP